MLVLVELAGVLTKMLEQKDIDYINSLTYEEMLRKFRFAPLGDPLFYGDSGEYFLKVMSEKKQIINHAAISKKVGWKS